MERKKALVTGAGHGIGKAIAIELAKHGYDVGINCCRSKDAALDTCRKAQEFGAKAAVFQADVSKNSDIERMFREFSEQFGGLDLMVNNAGLSKFYPFLDVTEQNWEEITFTDWKGAFFCSQFAAKNMISNQIHGLIINISSNHVNSCWPNANIYAPSKAALTKFGENAAMELAPHHIRVITVAPGYTDVGWGEGSPIYEAADRIPLKRFAKPEEVASIIRFLASDACSYMTGNCVTIDGGALLPNLAENTYYQTDAWAKKE